MCLNLTLDIRVDVGVESNMVDRRTGQGERAIAPLV
jgi:hypothetical protein